MSDFITKLAPATFSLKEGESGSGAIRVEFATLNVVDKDGDVTLPGAIGKQDVRIQPYGHDTYSASIGKGSVSEIGGKAVLEGMLNLAMPEGKSAYESLKFDIEHGPSLQEWSYTFKLLEWDYRELDGEPSRHLKSLKIYSVDPVFIGAGDNTRTLSVKSYSDDDFQKAVDAAVEKTLEAKQQEEKQNAQHAEAMKARLEYEKNRFEGMRRI